MAAREINLIPSKRAGDKLDPNTRLLLRVWTPLALAVFCLMLFAVLGFSLLQSRQFAGIEASIATEKKAISAREQDEGLYLLLKQKILAIERINSARYPFIDTFDFFNTYIADTLKVNNIKINEDGNVGIEVETKDSIVLDGFIRSLLDVAQNKFTQIELLSVQYTSSGAYSIVLDITNKPVSKTP